jgi:dienelactone hydrolase
VTDLAAALRVRLEWGAHPLAPDGWQDGQPRFRTAGGEAIRGFLCRPPGPGPHPAVLVIHAHGNAHGIGAAELVAGRPALQGPLGPALAAAGIASLCLDLPCFGDRAGVAESAAAKAALWRGGSLAGQMVGESKAALDWLAAQDWVMPGRIGVFGISMGATLGYWLAGIDPRVRAVAHLCCLADFAALIAGGAHDLHGIYLCVPGLIGLAPNGVIAGLAAPRAQFAGLGDRDPLTPPAAADIALAQLRAAYAAGGRLVIHREPDEGHRETPAMRAAVMAFLRAELGPA